MEQRSIDFKQCYVQRIIELPTVAGKFITTSYKPATGSYDYFEKESDDFGFELNHVSYSGKSKWQLAGINTISDANKGYGVSVRLVSEDQKVEVALNFLLYPNLPVIRKSLAISAIQTTKQNHK